jgi:proteasome lid subunit RPN8/RPN11
MKDETLAAIKEHAVVEYPREACGLVSVVNGREKYVPCRNIAETPLEHFILSPEDYASAEDDGEIIAVVHSHPNTSAQPSQADLVACESSGLEWIIVNVQQDAGMVFCGDVVSFKPKGYEAPYVGRQFVMGMVDCYTLAQDFYKREFGIELREYARRDEWWKHGENLYAENFAAEGFVQVTGEPRRGDAILMQLRSKVPNHVGIYIGDGKVLHHIYTRLSSIDLYDGYFQEMTYAVLRHESLMQ